jgi:hypothetical protein
LAFFEQAYAVKSAEQRFFGNRIVAISVTRDDFYANVEARKFRRPMDFRFGVSASAVSMS